MSKADAANESVPDPNRVEAERLLTEIKAIHVKAGEYLITAEQAANAAQEARKKADDNASYANNAKISSEEHSKSVAAFKGQVEADINAIATNKQKSDDQLASLTASKATLDENLQTITQNKIQTSQSLEETTKATQTGKNLVQEIQQSKESSEEALTEAKEILDKATRAQKAADVSEAKLEEISKKAIVYIEEIETNHVQSKEQSDDISTSLETVKKEEDELAKIVAHLTNMDGVVMKYEDKVQKILLESESLLKRVEDLVPGVTGASLASAFNKQKERFGSPQRNWIVTFGVCMALLICLSIPNFINGIYGNLLSWGEVFRGFAMRLPILLPLIWIAIYAGRNYMLSLRLEEDYAYKEAISIAFEGYKREMGTILAKDVENRTPIAILCANVLKAIAERPGRIYDGKHQDVTIISEAHQAVSQVAELAKRQLAEE